MRRGFGRSDGPLLKASPERATAEIISQSARWRPKMSRVRLQHYKRRALGRSRSRAAAGSFDRRVCGDGHGRKQQSTGGRRGPQLAGSSGSASPDRVCSADRLVADAGIFGRTARIPRCGSTPRTITTSRRPWDAACVGLRRSRRRRNWTSPPPFGGEGHGLLAGPVELWWPSVERFLGGLRLPTTLMVELPALAQLPAPNPLNAASTMYFNYYPGRAHRRQGLCVECRRALFVGDRTHRRRSQGRGDAPLRRSMEGMLALRRGGSHGCAARAYNTRSMICDSSCASCVHVEPSRERLGVGVADAGRDVTALCRLARRVRLFPAGPLTIFGFALYGQGVYLVELQRLNGWPASLISGAAAHSLLIGNVIVIFTDEIVGGRRVRPSRGWRFAGDREPCRVDGAAPPSLSVPWLLYAAFALVSLGWVGMGAVVISALVGAWFEKRRGLAISLAFSGRARVASSSRRCWSCW